MGKPTIAIVMTAALALIAPKPGTAIIAIPAMGVGPPQLMTTQGCPVSFSQPGGAGPGMAIPFPALALGAPVRRTATSFTTGGGGTSNAMVAAQRKAARLPYAPPTVDPNKATLPATFAVDRGGPAGWPYQRLPLTGSKRLATNDGLIFSQAISPSRGRIAALALYMTGRPTALPRLRITVDGPPERSCRKQVIHVYAQATSAAALARLLPAPGRACTWTNLSACPRPQWPRGRVLFVSQFYGTTFEYRWIDYDLMADLHFARATR